MHVRMWLQLYHLHEMGVLTHVAAYNCTYSIALVWPQLGE